MKSTRLLTEGKLFALVFPRNLLTSNQVEVKFVAKESATIKVEAYNSAAHGSTHTLGPLQEVMVTFPKDMRTSSGVENKGVIVTADQDISVQVANYGGDPSGTYPNVDSTS